MAKKINILKTGGTVPYADGGLKLSKSISIVEIEEHPEFKTLFPIDTQLLERLTESIKTNGFKGNHPVDIWITTQIFN